MTYKRIVSCKELFPLVEDLLRQNLRVKFTVSGNSMLPFIRHNKDKVLLGTFCKATLGDIVLFRMCSKYILHRIYKIRGENVYTIGDACLFSDGSVPVCDIVGRVERIFRGDLDIDCNNVGWCLVFAMWRKLRIFRRQLLYLYSLMARIRRKIIKGA